MVYIVENPITTDDLAVQPLVGGDIPMIIIMIWLELTIIILNTHDLVGG